MDPSLTVPSAELRELVTTKTTGFVQFDPTTFEPYCQLPAPYDHIRLTPPRETDLDTQVEIMNDIKVARTLMGIPYPYSRYNAERWGFNFQKTTKEFLASFEDSDSRSLAPFDKVPLNIVRDYSVDPTGALIGEVGIWDLEMGMSLRASHHGKGIATAVVRHIIAAWIVPHTDRPILKAQCLYTNMGSRRLWEKNGFVLEEVEGPRPTVKIDDAKGGGEEPECMAVWTRPTGNS